MKNKPVVIHQSCHPHVSHKCHPRVSLSGICRCRHCERTRSNLAVVGQVLPDIKSSCHPRFCRPQDSGISTLFFSSPLEGEGGTQCRVRGYQRAFTLIELLVMVLIIGILSAVAVPQYQKAVDKSRAMKGLLILKNIQTFVQVYELEQGNFPFSLDSLNAGIPGEFQPSVATKDVAVAGVRDTLSNAEWELQLENASGHQRIWLIWLVGKYEGSGFFYDNATKKISCFGKGNDFSVGWPFCEKLLKCSTNTGRYTKWFSFDL